MDNLNDLKAIWHTAKTNSLPSSTEMYRLIKRFRSQKLRNKWMIIIAACLLSLLMVIVLFVTPFKLVTTYTGGAMIIAGGMWLAVTNIRSLGRFYRLDDCSNADFLAFIAQTRQNQLRYYKRTMVVIVLLCSIGWMLYMYEPLHQHTWWFYVVYAVMLTYLAVLWFVVRPRAFKKDEQKLDATKAQLERISNQLKY